MMDTGQMTITMEKDPTSGMMDANMKVNLNKTNSMEMVSLVGIMEPNLMENGMMERKLEMENCFYAAEGMPFRDAYKKVGLDIEAGKFTPCKDIHHTHEGSIGNLMNDQIAALMQQTLDGFGFERVEKAEAKLLGK